MVPICCTEVATPCFVARVIISWVPGVLSNSNVYCIDLRWLLTDCPINNIVVLARIGLRNESLR